MSIPHCHKVGRKKRQLVDDTAVVQYMLMNGFPPRRASTEIDGYWYYVARAVSGIHKPPLRFTKAVTRNWYCTRSGIQDTYSAASSANEARVSVKVEP